MVYMTGTVVSLVAFSNAFPCRVYPLRRAVQALCARQSLVMAELGAGVAEHSLMCVWLTFAISPQHTSDSTRLSSSLVCLVHGIA